MFPGEAPCRHPCRRLRYGIRPGSSLTGWFLPPDRVRLGVKSHPGGEEGGEGAPTDGEGDQQPHAQGQDSQEIDEDDQQEKSKEFEPVRSHPAPAQLHGLPEAGLPVKDEPGGQEEAHRQIDPRDHQQEQAQENKNLAHYAQQETSG